MRKREQKEMDRGSAVKRGGLNGIEAGSFRRTIPHLSLIIVLAVSFFLLFIFFFFLFFLSPSPPFSFSFDTRINAYVPHNKQWIKDRVFAHLKKQAGQA